MGEFLGFGKLEDEEGSIMLVAESRSHTSEYCEPPRGEAIPLRDVKIGVKNLTH